MDQKHLRISPCLACDCVRLFCISVHVCKMCICALGCIGTCMTWPMCVGQTPAFFFVLNRVFCCLAPLWQPQWPMNFQGLSCQCLHLFVGILGLQMCVTRSSFCGFWRSKLRFSNGCGRHCTY